MLCIHADEFKFSYIEGVLSTVKDRQRKKTSFLITSTCSISLPTNLVEDSRKAKERLGEKIKPPFQVTLLTLIVDDHSFAGIAFQSTQ